MDRYFSDERNLREAYEWTEREKKCAYNKNDNSFSIAQRTKDDPKLINRITNGSDGIVLIPRLDQSLNCKRTILLSYHCDTIASMLN